MAIRLTIATQLKVCEIRTVVGLYKRTLRLAQEKGNDAIAALVNSRLAELATDSASRADANRGTGAGTSDL